MWFDCIPQADCEELSFQLGEVLGSALVNRKDLKSNILQARTKVKDFVRKLFKGGGKKKALSRLNDSDTVKPATEPNLDPTDVGSGSAANRGQGDVTTSPWLADKRIGVVSHLEQFRDGGSWVMTKDQWRWFVKGRSTIGDSSGQFITTRASMDRIIANSAGDLDTIGTALGFDSGHFAKGGGLVRIDVQNPLLHNIRMPSGLERGANSHFRWGGYTDHGSPEAVIDVFDVSDSVVNFLN